jgi:glycosyltransferase involved in cell wall biosynthesis
MYVVASKKRPLAVISHILPPSPSGQAVMLHRLLRNWDPKDYCLLSRQCYGKEVEGHYVLRRLPAQYYYLKPAFHFRGLQRFTILELVDLLFQTLQRARNIVRIVKRERCQAVMACSGDLLNLPASYLASRWMHVPFYAYIFDDYLYQWTKRLHRNFARCAEHIALRKATAVVVPNEFLRDEYHRRYQIEPTVVHNPCEYLEIDKKSHIPWPSTKDEINIVYTGAIYHAHFDAFRNLIAAIDLLGRTNIQLHLYTAQPRVELEKEDICGPIIYHNHIAPPDLLVVQKKADILFLALAFNSAIPEVIKTSAPGKMGEYLASGRPVLVHAPRDSFVSWYFKKYKCGVVVDQNKPETLSQAILHIIDNVKLRMELGKNARARAHADFDLHSARMKFLNLFQPKRTG